MNGGTGMEDSAQAIRRTVKDYLMKEFLPGEDPQTLKDDTPLITSGILNSIQITQLVVFIEESHQFQFKPQELTADYLNTLESIAQIVQVKLREN